MDTAVEWDEDAASRAPYALSEENLRIHNAAIPKVRLMWIDGTHLDPQAYR